MVDKAREQKRDWQLYFAKAANGFIRIRDGLTEKEKLSWFAWMLNLTVKPSFSYIRLFYYN